MSPVPRPVSLVAERAVRYLRDQNNISYAIIQESRIFFENEALIRNLRASLIPVIIFEAHGVDLVEVYKL